MSIKLNGDRVLIEEEGETKTTSGLVIAKTDDPGDVKTGIVRFVGPGKRSEDGSGYIGMNVSVGDKVIFQYGKEFLLEGNVYQLVSDSDIIVIV